MGRQVTLGAGARLSAALAADLSHHLTAGNMVGIGIDLVEIAEFERRRPADHPHFYERFFSPEELAYCLSRPSAAQHFAARYAAKEATVKALNGIVPLAYWQIEVIRRNDGEPRLAVWNAERSGPLAELAPFTTFISLSHSQSLAAAAVVVSRSA